MSEKSPADPLIAYLDELVEDLRTLVPAAAKGDDVDAIHDARVATRRLKAGVDLLEPVLSGRHRKPFERVTKKLRKRLGPLRDLDVMLEHMTTFKAPRQQEAIAWLKEHLRDCREKVVDEAEKEESSARVLAKLGTWWGLREEICEAHDAITCLLAESVHLQLDAFAEQANELVAAVGRSSTSNRNGAGASSPPRRNDPHQLRIAGKSLRYTLEMAKEHGQRLPADAMGLFKRLQEALGIWHDYVVLTERMLSESAESDLALHAPDLQVQMLGLAQLTLRKAQQQLNKVAELWKQRGEDLAGRIRQSFPLTRPASNLSIPTAAASVPETAPEPHAAPAPL